MGLQQPVFLDSTVLSNFASTDSVDWLIDLLEDPAVTPEVARELREGIAAGYDFLQPAVDAIDDGIRLHETPGTMIGEWADQLGERLDPGEAESVAYAAVEQGTLATDDIAARELVEESSARLTGSIGLLVLGIDQGVLDIETANQWLDTWRRERGYYAPVQRVEEVFNEE